MIAVYMRVSTEDQSVGMQKDFIDNYILRTFPSGEEILYYIDEGVSGSKDSRPGLNELLNDMRMGKIDTIIVYKTDRLSRSLQFGIQLLHEFKNRKVRFISASEGIDSANKMSEIVYYVLGIVAEWERENIRERVKQGMKNARKEGKNIGRPKGSKDKKQRKKGGYYLRYKNESKGERNHRIKKQKMSKKPSP